jgi:hypothetical protein
MSPYHEADAVITDLLRPEWATPEAKAVLDVSVIVRDVLVVYFQELRMDTDADEGLRMRMLRIVEAWGKDVDAYVASRGGAP